MRVVKEEYVDEDADQNPFNPLSLRALPNPPQMISRTHSGGGKRRGEAFGMGGDETIEGVATVVTTPSMHGHRGVGSSWSLRQVGPLGPCAKSPTNLGVANQVPLGKVRGPTPGGGGTTTWWQYTAPPRGTVTHSPPPPPPLPPRAAAGGMAAAGEDEEQKEEERGSDIAERERERDAAFTSMSGCNTNGTISREQVRCVCVCVRVRVCACVCVCVRERERERERECSREQVSLHSKTLN